MSEEAEKTRLLEIAREAVNSWKLMVEPLRKEAKTQTEKIKKLSETMEKNSGVLDNVKEFIADRNIRFQTHLAELIIMNLEIEEEIQKLAQ